MDGSGKNIRAATPMRRRFGIAFVVLGAALLIAAALLFSYNAYEDERAGQASDATLAALVADISDPTVVDSSGLGYLIDGRRYCGFLEVPTLDLALPILSSFSYEGLKVAPCCYSGSAATNDLVIAAHSYRRHFGRIGQLGIGDMVVFTGLDGISHRYAVGLIETVQPEDTAYMVDSSWDLTLFTCTYGGAQRVTVRCKAA